MHSDVHAAGSCSNFSKLNHLIIISSIRVDFVFMTTETCMFDLEARLHFEEQRSKMWQIVAVGSYKTRNSDFPTCILELNVAENSCGASISY